MSQWVNQYKTLINTKPSSILPCQTGRVSETEREIVQGRASLAKRVFVELGSGSGGHLLELGSKNPDDLFVGFEIRYKRIFRSIQKAERASVFNLLILKADAGQIDEVFAESSVDGIYINFPDPWDKRRWAKHRLLNEAFLTKLVSILKDGGFFSYKTDHERYFDETLTHISRLGSLSISKITRDLMQSEHRASNVPTEFENLFKSQGLPIFFLEAKKTRDPGIAGL